VKGYLSLGAMMLSVLTVSLLNGADWKILIVGAPLFVIFFVGITYQFVKEMQSLNRRRFKEPG
jgi:membrane protein implicated in regulation of membrane protease activity